MFKYSRSLISSQTLLTNHLKAHKHETRFHGPHSYCRIMYICRFVDGCDDYQKVFIIQIFCLSILINIKLKEETIKKYGSLALVH